MFALCSSCNKLFELREGIEKCPVCYALAAKQEEGHGRGGWLVIGNTKEEVIQKINDRSDVPENMKKRMIEQAKGLGPGLAFDISVKPWSRSISALWNRPWDRPGEGLRNAVIRYATQFVLVLLAQIIVLVIFGFVSLKIIDLWTCAAPLVFVLAILFWFLWRKMNDFVGFLGV